MKACIYALIAGITLFNVAQAEEAMAAGGASATEIMAPDVAVAETSGTEVSATGVSGTGASGTGADAFQLIDAERAKNMDADARYVAEAILRNQAALDAAKAILKTSYDADIRMMAGDSMKLHDAELRILQGWMALHGPRDTTAAEADAAPTPLPAAALPDAALPAPDVAIPHDAPPMEMLDTPAPAASTPDAAAR